MSDRFPRDARVGVLMGGHSSEREVSLRTGRALVAALARAGYTNISEVDLDESGLQTLVRRQVDVLLIALHGGVGENGSVQGLLECVGIPYSGAGVLASALAMDKVRFKHLLAANDIPTPRSAVWERTRAVAQLEKEPLQLPLPLPFVLKPSKEGSSVGVAIIKRREQLRPAIQAAMSCSGDLLFEEYIEGAEVTVGVLSCRALGSVQIVPGEAFYDYTAKYHSQKTQYLLPAPLPEHTIETLHALSERVYRLIDCRGVARVDFMVDLQSEPWMLEINTIPGMTETSLVPKIAQHIGIPFPEFASRLLQSASLDGALDNQ